jgi:hypothetical protein
MADASDPTNVVGPTQAPSFADDTEVPGGQAATIVQSLLGAPAWGGQVWPTGKPLSVVSLDGGILDAWGDQAPALVLLEARLTPQELSDRNAERAALCMPRITPTSVE